MTIRKGRTMFGKAKNKQLAGIVRIDTPAHARKAACQLESRFKHLKTRDAKVRTKRATILASNRVGVMLKKRSLSAKERRELKTVRVVYQRSAGKMNF